MFKYAIGCGATLLCSLVIAGCSFQSYQAAPVVSIANQESQPRYDKGSLTSDWYRVKKGDTLYSISWGAGKDFIYLAKRNNLREPYTIYPGQILGLTPRKTAPTSTKKTNNVVTAKAGKPTYTTNKIDKNFTKQPVKVKNQSSVTANNRTKKELDNNVKSAYSVTTTQQKVNQTVGQPISTLPNNVAKWLWPVKGRVIGRFSANEQGNQGIKIAGKRGDIIKAAADGRVVYAGNALRGYGNLVIIKHNDDYLSAYAHADKIMVKEKQYVNAGQTVALMGSTGANKVMLHFEIRFHGKSVNPLKYLPKQ
ncbi:peptidoglycan DD-metalloendopeptidase family protein [Shewanella intestini]|uniref:Peptidoglycan DD-metalloendopeptidase family protein n=1 Tax=Shewanella intestini TaxID=2017544 RepID=A0ABS5HZR0_9GAMM|nr:MULTISPECIES: peptidoglycan DD-metalloendopeptidase family protein [Shewanella]MBR9726530.1 peptidoglycan DD-metalloendopeptidase family protein [Shewanella intestini]MRG34904.1 peptidoglycan DD-metalloendopeptidase family protein [Shewanella sp. XMDDZSB0408]